MALEEKFKKPGEDDPTGTPNQGTQKIKKLDVPEVEDVIEESIEAMDEAEPEEETTFRCGCGW